MKEEKNTWKTLSRIDCNDKVEKKDGLTYLSWAWAWGIVKENYPNASYEVKYYNGKPYLYDEVLGYLVTTSVTIQGDTLSMSLPVMDSKHKSMKSYPYQYKTKYGVRSVEAATMFDINTAIMRCMTKNLALFGLGHYIYAGEDLPTYSDDKEIGQDFDSMISAAESVEQLVEIYNSIPANLHSDERVRLKHLCQTKKEQLTTNNK